MTDLEKAKTNWPEYFGDNTILLDGKTIPVSRHTLTFPNGEKMLCRFATYLPGIAFLINENNATVGWNNEDIHGLDLNIMFDTRDPIYWMPGKFWISKKGTSCFRPDENGEHILVRSKWGGPFNPTRGTEFPEVKEFALYAKYASSKGGGEGYNYYVFPKDFHREISEDDI